MKKTSTLICLLIASTMAQSQTITTLPSEEEPLNVLSISRDGKYLCGTTFAMNGFVADWKNSKIEIITDDNDGETGGTELRHVSNNGIATGFNGDLGVLFNINGERTDMPVSEVFKYVLSEDISADGSIVIGSQIGDSWNTNASVKRGEGEWTLLQKPEGADSFNDREEFAAKYVSGDGKVIAGYVSNFGPAILWRMQDDGSYKADPIYREFYEPCEGDETEYMTFDIDVEALQEQALAEVSRDDYETDEEYVDALNNYYKNLYLMEWYNQYYEQYDDAIAQLATTWTKPYYYFSACGISNNGKYVLLKVTKNDGAYGSGPYVAIYDTELNSVKVFDEPQDIDEYELGLTPTAIADDGTIIGYIGSWDRLGGFVIKSGESQAKKLQTLCPEIADRLDVYDLTGMNTPVGISADGRYITGFGLYVDFDNPDDYGSFETYVIDTQAEGNAVKSIEAEKEAGEAEYFTLDGRKVSTPVKGVNIMKTGNGETKKIVVK